MPIKPPDCPPIIGRKPSVPKPPPPPPDIDPKLLKILQKYKYNWRLTQLSRPVRVSQKFVPKEEPVGYYEPKVRKDVLEGKIPERIKDLMTIPLWKLIFQKNIIKALKSAMKAKDRKKRLQFLNTAIKNTWNSVYYFYRKTIREKKRRAEAAALAETKGKKKEMSKEEKLKIAVEYCKNLATPKKVFAPPPKKRKVVKDWNALNVHMDLLAEPKNRIRKFKRPSQDSKYDDLTKVKPKALKYTITTYIDELAHRIPARYLVKEKPIIPGKVKRGALKAKITPRVEEISSPKKRADAPEMDVKENPFAISPNALKYKISTRIEELSKPRERS